MFERLTLLAIAGASVCLAALSATLLFPSLAFLEEPILLATIGFVVIGVTASAYRPRLIMRGAMASACLVAAALMLMAAPAFAAETVSIPWGDIVASIVSGLSQTLGLLLLAAATAVISMLPAWVRDIIRPALLTYRADQLFDKLAATVVAGTRGVVAGKTVEITIANQMIRDLVQLAIDRGSPAVIDFVGRSAASLAEKALARLHEQGVIPPDYSLAQAKAAAASVPIPQAA